MSCQDLTECRNFLEEITSASDEDSWYIKVGSYYLEDSEILGEVTNWTLQFLAERKCPASLTAPITRNVVENVQNECKKSPTACGINATSGNYEPSALKQMVVTTLKTFCQRLLDNVELNKILPSRIEQVDYPKYVVSTVRNRRRYMEDRHICIDDFNGTYNIQNAQKASFYAVFDGHNGHNAAVYSASQLPLLVATDPSYPENPGEALKKAFLATDAAFLEKCKRQTINGGTTAVCALHFPQQSRLYVAWVGDSKALLVKKRGCMQIVKPHKANCPIEGERIKKLGGTVINWYGTLRVNGLLDISRAIGDSNCKPFVISDPDITCLELDNEEDFLVLASDGLWDFVNDDVVAHTVYKQLQADCENLNEIPQSLIEISKLSGSSDNITVIVVFLKHPSLIVKNSRSLVTMETTFDNCNNADLNNPVQNLLQNANTEFKTEKSNEIFKTDNPFNDGLNNFVQIGDINKTHTKTLDSFGEIQQQGDLPECEQIYNFGDEMLETTKINNDKRPFDGDIGPETSVDVPDDGVMTTESSEENLSKSSLSHSKDAFLLSDNLNPFDRKASLSDLETNEFQMQDDTKTCTTTPSENMLDTPVDPVSSLFDDTKQTALPTDSVHTNGIHSDDDLVPDQLPISNECLKDTKNEENYFNEFESDNKGETSRMDDFIEVIKKNEHNEGIQHFHGFTGDDIESKPMDETKNDEYHLTDSLEMIKSEEHDIPLIEDSIENLNKVEESNIKSLEDGNIPDLHASSSLLQDFDKDAHSKYQFEDQDDFIQPETKQETFIEGDQLPPMDLYSSDSTIYAEDYNRKHSVGVIGDHRGNHSPSVLLNPFDSVQKTEEKIHSIDEPHRGNHSPPMLLDPFDSVQKAEEKIHSIDEPIIQELVSESKVFHQQEQVPQMFEDGFSVIKDEHTKIHTPHQISEFQEENMPQEHIALLECNKDECELLSEIGIDGKVKTTNDELKNFEEEVKEDTVENGIEAINEEKLPGMIEEIVLEAETQEDNQSIEQIYQPTAPESCEESEDEWKYMRLKGEGEKEIPKSVEETIEQTHPIQTEESIPQEEKQQSQEHLSGVVESEEATTIASLEESRDSTTLNPVEPSTDTLEISESQILDSTDTEVDDMTSQLNPDAKEFIPSNPSPLHFESSNGIPPIAATRNISADDVVAQSPRKGVISMDEILIPSEIEFDSEIAHCPSDIQISPEPRDELYQELNMKEAMHGSEKEEQVCDDPYDYNRATDLDNIGMKESIYIERTACDKVEDVMNSVQPLPVDRDEIKDTLMQIPVEPDESLKKILVDNCCFNPSSPLPEVVNNKLTQMTGADFLDMYSQQVDLSKVSESLSHPVDESELFKQQTETNAIKSPIDNISQNDSVMFESKTIIPSEPSAFSPVQVSGFTLSQTPATVEPIPPAEPTESRPSDIKKDEEKAEKILLTKPSIKVPETKKDIKSKAPSTTAAKKVSSSHSTTSSTDATKPKTSHATTKGKAITSTKAAPRPCTVPLASKSVTEKKATPITANAKPKVDTRSTVSLTATKKPVPKTKSDEQTKLGVKQTVSKTGVTAKPPIIARPSSLTSTASKIRTTATPVTNVTATKTSQRVALSASAKSASTTTTTSTTTKQSVTSPRSTVTSTLRKTEALKSPPGIARVPITKPTTTSVTSTRTPSLSATTTKPKSTTPTTAGKTSSTTTTTSLVPPVKKLPLSSSPRLTAQKRSPLKKATTPVKKNGEEIKKVTRIVNDVKLNGTATIEVAAEKIESNP